LRCLQHPLSEQPRARARYRHPQGARHQPTPGDGDGGGLGGVTTPAAAYGAFALWELIAIPLAGIVVAVIAAMIPGRWAARTNAVEVLHAE